MKKDIYDFTILTVDGIQYYQSKNINEFINIVKDITGFDNILTKDKIYNIFKNRPLSKILTVLIPYIKQITKDKNNNIINEQSTGILNNKFN